MTDRLDLDELEAMAKEHPSLIVTKPEILALISQVREAERIRGALGKNVVFNAFNANDPLAIRLEFETEEDRLAAANAIDQALAPATGGGDA